VRAAELDGVTIDAFGTLLELVDPLPVLAGLLPGHPRDEIHRAFRAEAAFYRERAGEGRDTATLAQLREACVTVFNDSLGSSLSAEAYTNALRFELLPGVVASLQRLRALGLVLAVVGNWDVSLHERLEEAGIASFFSTVVAAAGKPEPNGITQALREIGVSPARALHVGDDAADEQAAHAAGVRFAWAPLPEAVASIV